MSYMEKHWVTRTIRDFAACMRCEEYNIGYLGGVAFDQGIYAMIPPLHTDYSGFRRCLVFTCEHYVGFFLLLGEFP